MTTTLQSLWTGQTTVGAAASAILRALGFGEYVTIFIKTGAGVSAGVITIEESDDDTFAGTWSTITTISTIAASTLYVVHTTGAFRFIRVRISTNITGGTVDATAQVSGQGI